MATLPETKTFEIPKTYKAAVYDKPGEISIKITELQTPEPGPGEVLVRITHSGVCHSDLSVMRNGWAGIPPTPVGQIGGHEGVGIVHKIGPNTESSLVKLGDRVGIKWAAAACFDCAPCKAGFDGHCVTKKFSGYYTPGTFTEYTLAPANYVTPIPDGLSSTLAAPMLCAGLTSYSGLLKANAQAGDFVVVSGAGGGLGHLAIQLGRGMGFRMIGIDDASKKSLVLECGAEHFLNMRDFTDQTLAEEIMKLTDGQGAKAVIVCAGSNRAYAQALPMTGFGGTVVCVGIPEGEQVEIKGASPGALFPAQKRIVGSSVGSQKEAIECLRLAEKGLVKTVVKTERMEGLQRVFEEMSRGAGVGRVVLEL
ncbi:related to alcohol dehydrogenase, class V [Phialocephala subalpina]|uniref:Related to alcohol dehydrogenase, class V n=1 Tax=Phialocephala subalpina TaxID=576137 RepID=A0A1L7WR77_9HELO|nr:related to alcohol dehydrogenase, class V [Phialocephala subalpina]